MKRYIDHIKTKEPHQRRKHAMQMSGAIVGVLFVAWLATFSTRLGAPAQSGDTDPTQTASAANATLLDQGQAQLEVSTTSVYSY
jgi:hypothetical protein